MMHRVTKNGLSRIDSSTYLEMKYYLTQQQRNEVHNEPVVVRKSIKSITGKVM